MARLISRPARRTKPLRLNYRSIRLLGDGLFGLFVASTVWFLMSGFGFSIGGMLIMSLFVGALAAFGWGRLWERGRRVSGEARERGYRDSTGKR